MRKLRFSGPDTGRGLIGLVVAMAILGGIVAAVLFTQTDPGPSSKSKSGQTTIDASPRRGASDIQGAAVTACRANYEAAAAAASYYQTLYGKPPAGISDLRSIPRDSVSSSRFTISIDPGHPGQVEVAAGGHPAVQGDTNCAYAG
jgi:hypothetical protein